MSLALHCALTFGLRSKLLAFAHHSCRRAKFPIHNSLQSTQKVTLSPDMKTNHAFLISIRPRFAEMIFSGSKTVELRRVCPKVSIGDLALVYVSSPAMELRGSFEVGKILTGSPTALWKKV